MTAQRQAGRARAMKPAPSKISSKVASAAEREADDFGTLTDRAYRQIEELIVTLQLPPERSYRSSPSRSTEHRAHPDPGGPAAAGPRRPRRDHAAARHHGLRDQSAAAAAAARSAPRTGAADGEWRRRARHAGGAREFAGLAPRDRAPPTRPTTSPSCGSTSSFNILVATAARNEFARRSMGLMNALSRRFWYQHYQEVADLPLAAKLHAAVAEAIAREDRRPPRQPRTA